MSGFYTASDLDTVLLNCSPPGDINMPSASLSILKTYLEQHNYSAKVIYWNVLIFDLLRKYPEIKTDDKAAQELNVLTILPHLFERHSANSKQRHLLMQRFRTFLHSEKKLSSSYITSLLEAINHHIDNFISYKLKELTQVHSKFLFGISAKYYEWIWGLYLIEKLKGINEEVQTIVGGFSRKNSARSFISLNREIDYCMYGESEESLVMLMNALQRGKSGLEDVPCLFYREGNHIGTGIAVEKTSHEFRESLFPDYSDYFETIGQKPLPKHTNFRLPLDGTRGCSWNRCRFCVATQGIKYHERSATSLLNEMSYQAGKYNCFSFYTTDDDFNPRKSDRLMEMFNIIVENGLENKFSLETWLTPSTVNYDHLEKLASVTKLKLKAGLESTSDRLLEKMDKKNRFIDNLLFLLNADRIISDFHITYSIITDIPDETRKDVLEAIENLNYLRFFIPAKVCLCFNYFQLAESSYYFRKMEEKEKDKYIPDGYGIFAPQQYTNKENRFRFFFNTKTSQNNKDLWTDFKKVNEGLIANAHDYRIDKNDKMYYEFAGNRQIKCLSLSSLEINILNQSGNKGLCSEKELLKNYDNSDVLSSLDKLQKEKLIYRTHEHYLPLVSA
ncbi:MAG: B12-binding domain-containing radical SAM protein [Bacteroidota bacterium]